MRIGVCITHTFGIYDLLVSKESCNTNITRWVLLFDGLSYEVHLVRRKSKGKGGDLV